MSPRRPAFGVAAASAADAPAAPPEAVATERPVDGPSRRDLFAPKNFYPVLTVVTLAIGALSLLVPSTPSYDPWSWLLWAHQIIHGHLIITTGGTSWKPLPMIFTIPFALFGKAAPDLWLIVARAGALAAVVMVFRLAYRLTREVPGLFGDADDPALGRLTRVAPALLAGVIAAVSLALSASGGFISSNTLGYSEGFAAALLLIAVERHLDSRFRQCFLVGFFVALDRPEIWLFWGPYGLWLFWKDPGARVLVAACFVLIPICWFLPVYAGCGSVTCSVSRATHPRSNSLAFASDPFIAELTKAAWPTMLLRIKAAAVVLGAVAVALAWRARRAGGGLTPVNRARVATTLVGLGGLAWFIVIALMTQAGFSGNNRYLVLGSALVDICGAVAFGWAARELALLGLRRWRSAGASGEPGAPVRRRAALQWAGSGLAALAFVFGPNFIGKNLISIPRTHGSLVYQAKLRQGMTDLVARYGGSARVFACGTVMTEGFQVPMVAWTLGVPATQVEASPLQPGPESAAEAPNVILQTRDTRSAHRLPLLSTWPTVAYHYVGTAGPVHMFTHCKG